MHQVWRLRLDNFLTQILEVYRVRLEVLSHTDASSVGDIVRNAFKCEG